MRWKKKKTKLFLVISCTKMQKPCLILRLWCITPNQGTFYRVTGLWFKNYQGQEWRMESCMSLQILRRNFNGSEIQHFCRCHPGLGCELMDQLLCEFMNI